MWYAIAIGLVMIIASIPVLLDLRNMRLIKQEIKGDGRKNIKIRMYKNHYGITYEESGKAIYRRCRVIRKQIYWLDEKGAS